MSEREPLPNPPDSKAVDESVDPGVIAEVQAAQALAKAKADEAAAAKAVAEAKEAEAKAAASIAEKKASAAGLSGKEMPKPEATVAEDTDESSAGASTEKVEATEELEKEPGLVGKLLSTFQESLLPQPNYAPGEEIKQIIYMAPYRATIPKLLAVIGLLLLLTSVVFMLLHTATGPVTNTMTDEQKVAHARELSNLQLYMWVSLIVALLSFIKSLQTGLAYKQWQFIITDMRTIITTPDPDQGLFADSIYLKDGTIKVLDTNFSKSPVWIPFQVMTGARDVMLSTGAYEFMENGAKVKGGIRFPDVTAADIKRLESLVFSGKK